jgi:hypothetical protein
VAAHIVYAGPEAGDLRSPGEAGANGPWMAGPSAIKPGHDRRVNPAFASEHSPMLEYRTSAAACFPVPSQTVGGGFKGSRDHRERGGSRVQVGMLGVYGTR